MTHVAAHADPKLLKNSLKLLQIVAFAFVSWYFFKPETLSAQGWNLLVIFVSTIIAIIAKPFPMGALAIVSISILCLTKTLPLSCVLEGFAYDQIWLIVFACFLARGFIKTGLGSRIAYGFISLFGGTPYAMGYGLLISNACISPLIPSVTARTGGIILPVLRSIVQVVGRDNKGARSTLGEYLTLVVMHGSVISSAMFLTASAANPIVAKIAATMGVTISWMQWAKAAIVPGLISLILLPPIIRFFAPCKVDNAKEIQSHAKEEIARLGKFSWQETIVMGVFTLLLLLWSCGSFFNIHAAEAALFGVSILLVSNILTWKDILAEDLAWDTFIWMGSLIMMASELQHLGVIDWMTNGMITFIPLTSWHWQLLLLGLVYFYSHYIFASVAAHISSMYGPFLAVAIAAGAPPLPSALFLGFCSSLFGGITHYSSGPAPILYAEQHVTLKTWWKVGFFTGLAYLAIWIICGGLWWKWLGIF